MEPFTVQCSTCQSRIRVRQASLIGQLANCPKCNSMIMITAPQQIQVANPRGVSVDSAALTKEAISTDLVNDPAQSKPESLGESDDEYRLAPAEPQVPPVARDTSSTYEDAVSEPSNAVDAWVPGDQPLVPSDQWTSQANTKTKQMLLVGFLGLSGVVLAIVLFIAFLRWYGNEPDSAEQPLALAGAGDLESKIDASQADPLLNGDSEVQPEDNEEQPASAEANSLTDDPAAASEHGDTPESGEPEQNDGSSDPLPSDLPAELIGDDVSADTLLGAGLADGEAEASADPAIQAAKEKLPEALREIAGILDYSVQPVIPDTNVVPTAPPVTAQELGLTASITTPAIPALDYAAHSQKVLPGLLFGEGLTLGHSINLWTNISGVPSSVALDSLTAANIDRNATVRVGKSEKGTIDDTAIWLAGKLGLEVDARENRYLQFVAPRDKIKATLPERVSVRELVGDPESESWLLSSLVALFPGTDGAWILEDGQLSYDASGVDWLSWFNVVRMLENWRSAQGLPSALDNYASGRVLNRFVPQSALSQLDHEITVVTPQARPVGQQISSLCREAGLECWIDWPNVGENGLGPNTTALAVTLRRPIGRILKDYARQFSLVIAIEGERTIWLTTTKAYRLQPRLYVLTNDGRTPEQVQQQLKALTPISASGSAMIDAIATPDNRFMILRCCRPVVQYPGV